MPRIIVAGAGHGGLIAAAELAKNGFDVHVYEKRERGEMGHDWDDFISYDAFPFCGLENLKEGEFTPGKDMGFTNPGKSVRLVVPYRAGSGAWSWVGIDRKLLINRLIDNAEKNGAVFHFGAEVKSAVTEGRRVTGAVISDENGETAEKADLVIDAAGGMSPVRRSLPDDFGIIREIPDDSMFYTYRIYYENTTGEKTEPDYIVYLYHCGRRGMDWAITEDKFVDFLVGKFGRLTREEIDEAVADFKKEYPYAGDRVVRGGQVYSIPLRTTLPVTVADGYALVGDSASMTEPLSGSGMGLSMKAGKLLAQTVLADKNREFTAASLWSYCYRYMMLFGRHQIGSYKVRRFATNLTAEELDGLLEGGVLTSDELASGGLASKDPAYLLGKLKAMKPLAHLLPTAAKLFVAPPSEKSVIASMPVVYDCEKVRRWAEKYEKL